MTAHDPALVETAPWSAVARALRPHFAKGAANDHERFKAVRAVLDALDLPGRERRAKAEALREFRQAILDNPHSGVQDALDIAAEIPGWIETFIDPEDSPDE